MSLIGIWFLALGGISLTIGICAWWIERNSWRSNGFDSDPRLKL
jgi:hypothetical protein